MHLLAHLPNSRSAAGWSNCLLVRTIYGCIRTRVYCTHTRNARWFERPSIVYTYYIYICSRRVHILLYMVPKTTLDRPLSIRTGSEGKAQPEPNHTAASTHRHTHTRRVYDLCADFIKYLWPHAAAFTAAQIVGESEHNRARRAFIHTNVNRNGPTNKRIVRRPGDVYSI